MTKIIKPSTQKEKGKKSDKRSYGSYKYLDQYEDLLSMKMVPVSQTFIDRLGDDLLKWAREAKKNWKEEEQDLKISSFFTERYIGSKTCSRWLERFPDFKERYLMAKQLLGDARENGALRKKFDPTVVLKSMATYDPEWERLETWRAELTEQILKNEKQILEIREIVANNGTSTSVPRVGTPETPVSSI